MMRHLSVPSEETSDWHEFLLEKNWLALGCGIQNLGTRRGLPLSEKAPLKIKDFPIIELEPLKTGPKKWIERLPNKIFKNHAGQWPTSYDQLGDVVIIKIPKEVYSHANLIGKSLLEQLDNVRIICSDEGVQGKFRVRKLKIIASRNESTNTSTTVRENGRAIKIDPGKAYYSPRLANERLKTAHSVEKLANRLQRPVVVCDPYAGVGPALLLLRGKSFVRHLIAGDLNPDAINLLKQNFVEGIDIECIDAKELAGKYSFKSDVLLVNLPHEGLNHLPHLIKLLARGHEVMIRGWAITSKEELKTLEKRIENIFSKDQILKLKISKVKSYSPKDLVVSYEIFLIL